MHDSSGTNSKILPVITERPATLVRRLKRLPPQTLLLWLVGLLICVVGLDFFQEISESVARQVASGGSLAIDISVLTFFQRLHSPALDIVAIALSDLVFYPVVLGLTVIVSYLWIRWGQIVNAVTLLILTVGASMIDTALKDYFRRGRPINYFYIMNEKDFSFPSGHSLIGTVFYVGLAYLLTRTLPTRVRVTAIVLSLILGASIASSRVYFGVHYPSDVLGGFTLAIVWLLVVIGGSALWHQRAPEPSALPTSDKEEEM